MQNNQHNQNVDSSTNESLGDRGHRKRTCSLGHEQGISNRVGDAESYEDFDDSDNDEQVDL